jgi:predicted GNAT family acetyltransferase
MPVLLVNSAGEFLRQTLVLRSQDPFRTNLVGSVASSVASGARKYDRYFWWIISDNQGQVVGAAMRTAPHDLVLLPMSLPAVRELAQAVSIYDDELPGVAGPAATVREFLDAYKEGGSAGSTRGIEESGSQLIYALNKLEVSKASGTLIPADQSDFDLVLGWLEAFTDEAGITSPNLREAIAAGLRRHSLHFWMAGGEKVSMAGHAPLVETPSGTIARIGPVYTPKEHRSNGYASALTASLSEKLMARGAKVMLYTDAANPTSNSIYQRIGYELIDENTSFRFLS